MLGKSKTDTYWYHLESIGTVLRTSQYKIMNDTIESHYNAKIKLGNHIYCSNISIFATFYLIAN